VVTNRKIYKYRNFKKINMENEDYSPQRAREIEELKRKETFYRRIRKVGWAGYFAGLAIAMTSLANPLFLPEEPETYREYLGAKKTLSRLETKRNSLASKLQVEYETPEVREALDNLYKSERAKISELDRAIVSVREDIDEMKQKPEIRDYEKKEEKIIRRTMIQFLGGFLGCLLSISVAAYFAGKEMKYKIERNFEN